MTVKRVVVGFVVCVATVLAIFVAVVASAIHSLPWGERGRDACYRLHFLGLCGSLATR